MIDARHRSVFSAAMFTIIGGDGREYGPVSADQVRSWISGGRANLETQAKKAGDEQWRRLGDFPEFNEAAAQPPLTGEPAPAPAPAAPAVETPITDIGAHAAELFARSGKIDVFGCLDASFNLWKKHFLPLVGVTLLIIIIQMLIGLVPLLGGLAGIFLNGVFYGGLYYYYLGKQRGEPRELGDAFAGFSRAFGALALSSVLTTLILIGVLLICAGPTFVAVIKVLVEAGQTNTPPPFPDISPLAAAGCGLGALIVFYLSVAWAFTFALAVDKRIGPWTAMELSRRVVSKQWFRVFFVLLLGGILAFLGLFGLIIGFVFTLPLAIGAIICAYEALFNPPAKS